MNIYTLILYVVVILIFLWRITHGFKMGMVYELSSTISIIIAVVVGRILFRSYNAFVMEKYGVAISSILLLAVVFGIYKIIRLIIMALKLFSKLPVIKGVDRLLGILAGIIEAFVMIILFIGLVKNLLGM